MGFADRLSQDVGRVFLGAENFEEDLVLQKGGSSTDTVNLKGVVDVISYSTGAIAENEVNPSIMAMADIFIDARDLDGYEPEIYDKIVQGSFAWSVKQKSLENGMWTIRATERETRRRR